MHLLQRDQALQMLQELPRKFVRNITMPTFTELNLDARYKEAQQKIRARTVA